jgi:hypothetical protein
MAETSKVHACNECRRRKARVCKIWSLSDMELTEPQVFPGAARVRAMSPMASALPVREADTKPAYSKVNFTPFDLGEAFPTDTT